MSSTNAQGKKKNLSPRTRFFRKTIDILFLKDMILDHVDECSSFLSNLGPNLNQAFCQLKCNCDSMDVRANRRATHCHPLPDHPISCNEVQRSHMMWFCLLIPPGFRKQVDSGVCACESEDDKPKLGPRTLPLSHMFRFEYVLYQTTSSK